MKKLVTAACALVAASAFAVESANIVGYQSDASEAGFNWVALDFATIGQNSGTLGAISLDPESAVGYADNIQILGAKGNTLATYFWVNEDDEVEVDGVDGYYVGWVNTSDQPVADNVLAAGKGILVATKNANTAITISPNL